MSRLPLRPSRGSVVHITRKLRDAGESERNIARVLDLFLASFVPDSDMAVTVRHHFKRGWFGQPGSDGLEVVFDTFLDGLAYVTTMSPSPTPLDLRSGKFDPAKHADELSTVDAYEVVGKEKNGETEYVWGIGPRVASLSARASRGNPEALSRLGVVELTRHRAPVAFRTSSSVWLPEERRIRRVEILGASTERGLDVVAWFDQLRQNGRLPLASAEDVRRFVMALASPLLRLELPGLLGIYWFHGPSGSGKDFLVTLLTAIWKNASTPGFRTTSEIRDPSGDEDRKTLGANPDVLYVRLKEAGKKAPQLIESLIQYTGSNEISVRRLYRDESSIPNAFTWIADSVESIPDRKEISRRTVAVQVAKMDPDTIPADVLAEVTSRAPVIIASLLGVIECAGMDALRVASPAGRAAGLDVLAKLFGANLDEVRGSGLQELFVALREYVEDAQLKRKEPKFDKAKAPAIASTVPVYSTAHFVDTMKARDGHRAYFERIRNAGWVSERIHCETEYLSKVTHGAETFLSVDVGGTPFGFRFVDAKGSMFLFAPVDPVDSTKLKPAKFQQAFPRARLGEPS